MSPCVGAASAAPGAGPAPPRCRRCSASVTSLSPSSCPPSLCGCASELSVICRCVSSLVRSGRKGRRQCSACRRPTVTAATGFSASIGSHGTSGSVTAGRSPPLASWALDAPPPPRTLRFQLLQTPERRARAQGAPAVQRAISLSSGPLLASSHLRTKPPDPGHRLQLGQLLREAEPQSGNTAHETPHQTRHKP